MPNIVITSTAKNFNINFGDYTATNPQLNATKEACVSTEICSVKIKPSQSIIKMNVEGEGVLVLCQAVTDNAMIVDSVNGVAPTDLQNLYDLLKAAKG